MEEKEPPGRTNCEKIIPRAIEMRKKESSWAALSLVWNRKSRPGVQTVRK